MDVIPAPKKTIEINQDLWNLKPSRKKTTPKDNKKSASINHFDSMFTKQLNELTEIIEKSKQNTHPNESSREPQYGNLKNGNKPTYRNLYANSSSDTTNNQYRPSNTIKYGFNPSKQTTKILIKGKKTRRKIKRKIKDINSKSITEIKNDLYNKSLIRCGTNAPPDVIREIYKNSYLTGNVDNSNKELIIHNYFSQSDSNDPSRSEVT